MPDATLFSSFDATPGADPTAAVQFATGGGSYRAIEDDGSRRPAIARSLGEDRILKNRGRTRLSATTRDTVRNFSVATWAVNKHLDYVSGFRFRATTPDEGYNRELQALMAELSRPREFDLAGRHGRAAAVRLTESGAVQDGDCFWAKHRSARHRGRVELLEGDRCRDEGLQRDQQRTGNWINGVDVDPRTAAARNYAFADRTESGFAPGRVMRAANVMHRAYWHRFDQYRGTSPLGSALNMLRDVDEAFGYAQAKVKLAQIMGLLFQRDADGPLAEYVANLVRADSNASIESIEGSGDEPRYDVDLSGGIFALDLVRGETAEILESKTPATETVNFLKLAIHAAVRALDLPYSFWDEAHTNFYGQRGSFLSYLQGAQVKRAANVELLDDWTRWRLGLAVFDARLPLPRGKDFSFLKWKWVAHGQPWWDPAKEITAQLMAISAGLANPQDICHETGTDFEENLDAIARALQLAQEKNIELSFDAGAARKAALAEEAMADVNTQHEATAV